MCDWNATRWHNSDEAYSRYVPQLCHTFSPTKFPACSTQHAQLRAQFTYRNGDTSSTSTQGDWASAEESLPELHLTGNSMRAVGASVFVCMPRLGRKQKTCQALFDVGARPVVRATGARTSGGRRSRSCTSLAANIALQNPSQPCQGASTGCAGHVHGRERNPPGVYVCMLALCVICVVVPVVCVYLSV